METTKKKVFLMLVEDQCDIWWWGGDSIESVIARYKNSPICEKGKDYIIDEVNPAFFDKIIVHCAEASLAGVKADFLLSDYMEHLTSTNFFDKHNPAAFLPCYIKD